MPIAGMTNKTQPYKNHLCGKIKKGNPKTGDRPGTDLKEKFRIEPASKEVADNLLKAYPTAEKAGNGDILIEQLDVIFASNNKDKTLEAWMHHWSGSTLLRRCDRHTIEWEAELKDDRYGNKRHVQIPSGEPCPLRDEPVGVQCPLGCTQEAKVLFYIQSPQMREANINFPLPFEMTVHGFSDIDLISTTIDRIVENYGNLTTHSLCDYFGNPVPIADWGITIPFVLSRTKVNIKRPVLFDKGSGNTYEINGTTYPKRTGKKADGVTYSCLFQLNSQWLTLYEDEVKNQEYLRRRYQEMEQLSQMIQRGLKPSSETMKMLTGGTIDVEIIDAQVTSIPQLPEATISEQEWQYLKESFLANGWTTSGILDYLKSIGIERAGNIPKRMIDAIAQVAKDANQRQNFCVEF